MLAAAPAFRAAICTATSTGHLCRGDAGSRTRVYVCGPPALVEAVRARCTRRLSPKASRPQTPVTPESPGCGRITFSGSGIDIEDDGRPLLDQAGREGRPDPAERMPDGICHTCTRRKVSGNGPQPHHRCYLHRRRRRRADLVSRSPSATSTSISDQPLSPQGRPMKHEPHAHPCPSLEAFGRELDAIRERVVADPVERDVDYIRRWSRRSAAWRSPAAPC